jgi:seryl-tRNA synthetase
MFDIQILRDDPQGALRRLRSKNAGIDVAAVLALDEKRRGKIAALDELRKVRNDASQEIGRLLKAGEDAEGRIAAMKQVSGEISALEPAVRALQKELDDLLLGLPNLPHDSVPVGGADCNRVVRSWGEPRRFDFTPKDHIELAEALDIIDFKRAAKLSGSNFILFKGPGARLERALYNFMLDLHTSEHGYREVLPPVLVNRDSMTGTGQLPKMEDDMYRIAGEDLFLIPTAEVPVTNIHRDEVLPGNELPVCYAAYTPCFRREAGSYGKETRGLVRVHQFDKVELVKFVRPEGSYDELESLVGNAETVFRKLGLPYRVVLLASGDLSFAAAKCYDLEAHAAGMGQWLEVSSCSNFEDFQARRASIRFKDSASGRTRFVHTLNGSGIALARAVVAILENYQNADGSVTVPGALVPYMGGMEKITRGR